MKKLVVALLVLCSMRIDAQISYETTYSTVPGNAPLNIVQLTLAGDKYCVSTSTLITLYNLNHSVYMTIPIPAQGPGTYGYSIGWVSDQLFDTNPADIEYLLNFHTSTCVFTRVYDETGILLFGRDSFSVESGNLSAINFTGIQHTAAGTKMLMVNVFNNATAVYSLPGVLPCNMCDGGVISGIQPQPSSPTEQQQLSNPYPNPTNSTTTIPYTLPAGTSTGTIVIYDVAGREVKRYAVTNAFASLELSTTDLAEGTYSYALEAGGMILPGKKFVLVR